MPFKAMITSHCKDRRYQSSLAADIAYFKRATMGEKRTPRKRVYFPDLPAEDLTSKKTVRIVKGGSEKYHDATPISLDKSLPDPKSSETIVVDGDSDEQSEILLEPAIDVEGYEEVTETEEYDDGSGALADPYLVLESRDVVSGSSLRELKGENSYLKEQLHASVLRFCESKTTRSTPARKEHAREELSVRKSPALY
ncbi:hypothetical protein ANCCAN_08011 [Ancylostoma caninum]|uniref:Uncharacterized protein n=1 Tax=Ancylostoma caninum TaxID=29170 RepID=A0A368GNS6_ANCCA|nr:hypothetical protein ANCCAN_08011 [Ancylostoma caninum]